MIAPTTNAAASVEPESAEIELQPAPVPAPPLQASIQLQQLIDMALRQDPDLHAHQLDDELRELIGSADLGPELVEALTKLSQSVQDPKVLQSVLQLLQQAQSPQLEQLVEERLDSISIQNERDMELFFELINRLREIDTGAAIVQIVKRLEDLVLCERLLAMLYGMGERVFEQAVKRLLELGSDMHQLIAQRVRAAMSGR